MCLTLRSLLMVVFMIPSHRDKNFQLPAPALMVSMPSTVSTKIPVLA